MSHFQIQFAYPWSGWLLFLLIPAIAVPLILHFRVPKRYRRTRYRIISLVLHLAVMVLSVCALSGMIFTYHVENPDNEILLLVDVSDTEEESQERRDEFVQAILEGCGYDGFKTGVVTFGFDQVYAVPLGYDTAGMYDAYLQAEVPDTSATDVAAALNYAATLFSGKGSSKIVLITDGKETDEAASSVIGTIAAQGVRVDVVYVSSDYDDTVQVVSVTLPDYHVNVGEECTVGVSLRSKAATKNAVVELYDNDVLKEPATQTLDLPQGSQLVNFRCVFETEGLHELKVRIRRQGDTLEDNDEYYAYLYLEVFHKVLILERFEGESAELVSLLTTNGAEYDVEVKNLVTGDDIPADIETLRKYDQVILNNVSNADLQIHEGLDRLLNTYVNEYGGGLLTVGGSEEEDPDTAHAYNREDMGGSLYQQMLPVQAIDYTPPVGVIFILDTSSSMDSNTGFGVSKRVASKEGLIDLVRNQVLTDRDYFGLMTLDTTYSVVLPLTRFTQQDVIVNAINSVNSTGGTLYSQAIARARQLLFELKEVERRHIVIITDGEPSGDDKAKYLDEAKNCWETNGTTLSVIGFFSEGSGPYQAMQEMTNEDHGHGEVYATSGRLSDVAEKIRGDLLEHALQEVVPEPFHPIVTNSHSNVFQGVEYGTDSDRDAMRAQLGGFYGVKVRDSDYLLLEGQYAVPIYAQWKYGAGSVGSFMCDLSGRWSSEFMHDDNGRRFLLNLIGGLMPTENIHPRDITYTLTEGNYMNRLSVDAKLKEGEYVRAEIVPVAGGDALSLNAPPETQDPSFYVTEYLTEPTGYSGCSFVIKRSGTYRIVLEKCASDGTVLETLEAYKCFSFSKEYDVFAEEEDAPARDSLAALAARGNGKLIEALEDRFDIMEGFEITLERQFDPTMLFMILAMVCFLLDIVVRKFKFKWPHELYREYKAKKEHG